LLKMKHPSYENIDKKTKGADYPNPIDLILQPLYFILVTLLDLTRVKLHYQTIDFISFPES